MKIHFESFGYVSLVSLWERRADPGVLRCCFLLRCDIAFCRSTEIHLLSMTVFSPDANWGNLLDQKRAEFCKKVLLKCKILFKEEENFSFSWR